MATPAKHTGASPVSLDLRRRSKRGCIDCKLAKVRCDEIRPSCGTCARRRRPCQGYAAPSDAVTHSRERRQHFISYDPTNPRNKWSLIHSNEHSGAQLSESSPLEPRVERYSRVWSLYSVASPGSETQSGSAILGEDFQLPFPPPELTMSCELMTPASPIPRSIPVIPPGTIPDDDAETINVYFNRHPFEQVISIEFVAEMNASVLLILQDSPVTVGDALYSIGRVYLEEESHGSLVPLALERRARALARLKAKDPSRELEEMLLTSIALSAMEGIDTKCGPRERSSPILITYATSIINAYTASGLQLSSLAKYFIRALARHDMILSLSQLRRNSIKTEMWLDQDTGSTDRFMGYTITLMPLLEELCALAEDIRHGETSLALEYRSEDVVPISPSLSQNIDNLRLRIQCWRWAFGNGDYVAVGSSGRLIAHAYAYRAAALLMLYRLTHPAGSSIEGDREAFQMACEVMAYLRGPPEDLRLSTWPAFIASCELDSEEDRTFAVGIFRDIYGIRKTGTSLQTMKFVMERVWKAKDAGNDWDWMRLSQRYPGECIPI